MPSDKNNDIDPLVENQDTILEPLTKNQDIDKNTEPLTDNKKQESSMNKEHTTTTHNTLYLYPVSPYSWKVKTLLIYKKIPFKEIYVSPFTKKELAFSKNWKQVPVYVEADGNQINDSTVIMKYLDKKYPESPVFEKTPIAESVEEQWINWADKKLARIQLKLIYGNITYSYRALSYFQQPSQWGKFKGFFAKICCSLVMWRRVNTLKRFKYFTPAPSLYGSCIEKWEKALNSNLFLGGNKPNGADLSVYGIIKTIESLPIFNYIKENQSVYNWFQRINSLIFPKGSSNKK